MKSVCTILLLLASFALPTVAQQTATDSSGKLTNKEIVAMVSSGLSADVVVAKIRTSACKFDTSPQALSEIKANGVPDQVILEMVNAVAAKTDAATPDVPKALPGEEAKFAYVGVYRSRRYAGSALAPTIAVDGKQIVRIGNGRRCLFKITPGPHTINSDDKSSAISIDAKPGDVYFVRIDEEPGFWKGHGKLTLVASEQGSAEYKLEKNVEDDRIFAKDMIVDSDAILSSIKK